MPIVIVKLLLALVLVYVCKGRDCASMDYWDEQVIEETDFNCLADNLSPVASAQCKKVQHAFRGNTYEITPGEDVNQPEQQNNLTVLMVASHQGNHTLVRKLLLENGAARGIDMRDKCGWSAVMFAAFTGHSLEVVELLLQHHADTDLTNRDNRSALFMATEGGHIAILKLLIENGASIKQRDRWGKPAISAAVYGKHGCQPDAVKVFLLNCAYNLWTLNQALWTAVHYCCPNVVNDITCSRAPMYDMEEILIYANQRVSSPKCTNCRCLGLRDVLLECEPRIETACGSRVKNSTVNPVLAAITAITSILSVISIVTCLRLLFRNKKVGLGEDDPNPTQFIKLLQNELAPCTHKWELIAINLEIDMTETGRIERSNSRDLQACLREVFDVWRRQRRHPFSWETIVEVLNSPSVGEDHLAQILREKYINLLP